MQQDITIPMPDGGAARAFVFTPDAGSGPWPTILFYMDGPGIRPALFEMGERMAQAGYYVLLPDLFWRAGVYEPFDLAEIFGSDEGRKLFRQTYFGSTGPEKSMADPRVFLDWLGAQPQARAAKIGTTGYCMGGSISLRAAGTFPDRVAAAASFHGGNMATDDENSPHRLAGAIRGKVLVAGAIQDAGYDDAQDERLRSALAEAGVDARVSIWEGCKHGWVPTDMPVYNKDGADRHWRELIALYDGVLK